MTLHSYLMHDVQPEADGPATGRERDQRIRVEQARLLWKSPVPQLANVINATIVCGITGYLTQHWEPIGWVGLMSAIVLLRFYLWDRHRRSHTASQDAQQWVRLHIFCSGLTGCFWGLSAWLIFHVDQFTVHVFLAMVISGMGAGAVAASSAYLPALVAFLLPSSLPLAVAFIAKGDAIHFAMAFMTVLFVILLLSIGRNLNRSLLETIALQIDNAELVESLAHAGRQLEKRVTARTAQLQKEIAQNKRTEQALRQSEKQLIVAKETAELANRSKSEFLANMSHELRTPLNAVIGFAEIIRDETLGPDAHDQYRDYAAEVCTAGRHQLRLIDEILELSKIDAGRTSLKEEPVDLRELVRASVALMDDRAQLGGVTLAQILPERMPGLLADERMLKQVMSNLLSNAVKFTPAGGRITIEASCDPNAGWRLQVTDTGIGISPEDAPRVMERFVQLEEQLTRNYDGTGLGLALCKSLLELHGGSLELQSEVGVGTTVTVHLPAERTIGPVGAPEDTASAARLPGPCGLALEG